MIKKIFVLAMLCITTGFICAQNVLEVKDISQPNDVYSSDGNEGAVIIKCNQSIPLKFVSTMDKDVVPFNMELQGSDSVYYIEFPTGDRYRGREITIVAQGYDAVSYAFELQPKQLLTLRVFDPNSMVDAGCYRGHRNKGVDEIKNMNYAEAKNQFELARECSDVDSVENEHNISIVDSLIYYRKQADESFKLLDYTSAADYYDKAVALNAYDTYATSRSGICRNKFSSECDVTFKKAEFYYTDKQFDKAKELYNKLVDRGCEQASIATERLVEITKLQTAKKYHSRVLTYEYSKNTPIGFSYGSYNMNKTGGFFELDFNNKMLDATRNSCIIGDEPEMNIAFGWTIKIADPVWIFFGPGATGKLYYGKYADNEYPGTSAVPSATVDTTKVNLAFAVSPVVGICVKYSMFAIRLTYQYRWATNNHLSNYIKKSRISFGIGMAF